MAHRSQCSSAGNNPLDPNYLPHHYREEYRLAIDALVEDDSDGYYEFLQSADVVDFLSRQEIEYIKCTVQVPHQSTQTELQCLGSGDDGSSDTYWPIHSDLDAPGLDLGWPQQQCILGPTEVTTLVNPSEPDMPSIKEQARRLIKNAQQLIAVVMDMFTDVDIFSDILDAAMRNVVVYILLDEQNVHHFINMVSNCRVNLDSIQLMRVRTVSGLTYYCRSGKSFKGQMMDRYLLTDCRAVLSGNYSFMWSFEKIHRCIAHLFLGQLVSTFDEEFRILFAQSQPLIFESALAPMPDFSSVSDRQYSTDRTPLFRDPRKFLPIESSCPEEWTRHSFEEHVDMDRKRVPLRRHEAIHRSLEQGKVEMYSNKYSTQQLRMDPSFVEQGHPMVPCNMIEMAGFKRHNYAEDIYGRPSAYHFMQHQAMHNFEGMGIKGRQLQREQHHYQRTEPEPDNDGYEKFRGQAYPTTDQYSEPVYPQDMEQPDSYNPVLHYLASTAAVEMEHDSDKFPLEDPFGQSHPKQLSVGQPYACQTSPTQLNPPEQKQFLMGSSMVCKTQDPNVKQGLRDWRISSYLSAFDDAGEEDLPMPPPLGFDPFEEPLNPLQGKSLGPMLSNSRFSAIELPKIPVPRKDQHPCYTKPNPLEHLKKLPEVTMATDAKTTPTPSESSSTTEGDKIQDMDVKEPREISITREESFRRKYNPTIQRCSRLRSSLIFSSQLENISQELKNTPGQHDKETANEKDDQSKLSMVSHLLGKQRCITRKPFEWSHYIKSADTADNLTIESSKFDDAGGKELPEDPPVDKAMISTKEQSYNFQVEQTKTIQSVHPPKPLLSNTSYVDMSNPDSRLMFFKELAAKRKAAKAAESESGAEKAPIKLGFPLPDLKTKTTVTEVPHNPEDTSIIKASTSKEASLETPETSQVPPEIEDKTPMITCESLQACEEQEDIQKNYSKTYFRHNEGPPRVSTDAEKIEYKNNLRESRARESSEFLEPSSKKPATSNVTSKESGVSATSKEFSSHETTTSNPASTKYSSTELTPSPNESISSNTATKELSPSHPLSPTEAFLSCPTQRGSSLTNSTLTEISSGHAIELSASHTLTTKDSSSSNPTSKEQLSSSNPVTFESNIQPLSPTSPPTIRSETSTSPPTIPSETSTSPPTIPSETSTSPPTIPSETSTSPPTIPSETSTSPPTIPSETSTSPPTIPSETSTSSPTIPSETSTSPPTIPSETSTSSPTIPSETSASSSAIPYEISTSFPTTFSDEFSLSPTPMQSNSSHTFIQTESIPLSNPTQTEPGSLPKPIPVKSTSLPYSTPIESNCSPNPCTEESMSTVTCKSNTSYSPTLTKSSTKTNPSSPGPDQSVLSPKPFKIESSASPKSTKTDSTSTDRSFSSPKHVTKEANIFPNPIQTDPNSSPNPTSTESSSSPDGPVLSLKPDKTKYITSPNLTSIKSTSPPKTNPTESSSSPNMTLRDSSSIPNPTESSASPNLTPILTGSPEPTPMESSPSHNPSPASESSIRMENSKGGKSIELNKEQESGSSLASKDQKKKGDAVTPYTVNKTTPEEFLCCGSQSTDETKVNKNTMTLESTTDQVNPMLLPAKHAKVSQSHYHSSTANVLSSSNLRDDTKLLLEQISANSQNRTELTKESAVTDDAKEDEADRDVSGEGEAPIRQQSRGRSRTTQERDKLLQRIESMRKERKVYSRFEMAP